MTNIDLSDFLHSAAPHGDHLDPVLAEDYLSNRVADVHRSNILRHLTDCKECRIRLAALKDVRHVDDADIAISKSEIADYARSLADKICMGFGVKNIRSEIYFGLAVLSIGLSFVWPARFWQFLTISLILTVRFAVLRLENKRFLKIERTIRSEHFPEREGLDGEHQRTRNP